MNIVNKYESRVLRLVPGGCWTIPGLKHNGQGYLRLGRDGVMAHRVFYEDAKGPIPDGLTLDHLCRNRACINPDHLEAVSNRVNVLRGDGSAARRARQTECVRGHALAGANLYVTALGFRQCVECKRQRTAEHHRRNAAKLQATQARYWASGRGAEKQRQRRAALRQRAQEASQ